MALNIVCTKQIKSKGLHLLTAFRLIISLKYLEKRLFGTQIKCFLYVIIGLLISLSYYYRLGA